jgi:hypothetical protein
MISSLSGDIPVKIQEILGHCLAVRVRTTLFLFSLLWIFLSKPGRFEAASASTGRSIS